MLRIIVIMGLAAVMSVTCLPQSNGNTQETKPTSAQASESGAKNFYQLSFVVRELENERVINSRSYSIILRDNERGSIRAGEQVPVATTSGSSTKWEQLHVGVNIDCRQLQEVGDRLALGVSADITSMIGTHEQSSSPTAVPITRDNRWDSTVIVPIKQPTILFSSDDPASKRKMQLQLTVTPLR